MGCGSGLFSPYTAEELDMEVNKLAPRLPIAELMNGGIIKLEGANGLFNPNSLLDPSWLKGKLTIDEYISSINYINKCAAHSYIGLSKIYSTSQRAMRLNLITNAASQAVQQLNERYSSVRFTYQTTAENTQINTSYETDPAIRYAQRTGPPVGNATKVMLFIAPK